MKQHTLRLMVFGIVLAVLLLLPACARQPQPARTEEITFQSGSFTLVGDLWVPEGTAPFPVILLNQGAFIKHSEIQSGVRQSTQDNPSNYFTARIRQMTEIGDRSRI